MPVFCLNKVFQPLFQWLFSLLYFPLNWAAGLILMITAPLVPLFMIIVGIAAADNSQKNMDTLSRLSAQLF